MSSAQYISVGRLYSYLVCKRAEAGYAVRIHPNAHTVVLASYACEWDDYQLVDCTHYLTSALTEKQPPLRRLVLEEHRLGAYDFTDPPYNWSWLTHLSLPGMLFLDLEVWYPFIRSFRGLQSGAFHFRIMDEDIAAVAHPPVCTLPSLAVLRVDACLCGSTNETQHPLQAAFRNLRLPAVHTLSLGSTAPTWYGASAITEVHAVLGSAPAVTTLSLGADFLGNIERAPAAWGRAVTPLAAHAPCLERLCFYVVSPVQRYHASVFCDRIFRASRWLDLTRPAGTTVREVTLLPAWRVHLNSRWDDSGDRSLFVSEVRRYVHAGVAVRFQGDEPVEVRRTVWGW
jgi:hypothetical protein